MPCMQHRQTPDRMQTAHKNRWHKDDIRMYCCCCYYSTTLYGAYIAHIHSHKISLKRVLEISPHWHKPPWKPFSYPYSFIYFFYFKYCVHKLNAKTAFASWIRKQRYDKPQGKQKNNKLQKKIHGLACSTWGRWMVQGCKKRKRKKKDLIVIVKYRKKMGLKPETLVDFRECR